MKNFYKRFANWSLPTRLGLLIGILSLIGIEGGTIIFGDKEELKFAPQTIEGSSGGFQIQAKNFVINQSIPKPEINFSKTESFLISDNLALFGIVGLGLKGYFATVYKLSVSSFNPIPRIAISTNDDYDVIWAISKISDIGPISNRVDGPMSSIDIVNAKGEYLVAVATTTDDEINLVIK